MPELILQISDHLIVNITQFQNWRDVKVVYEWINDGVRSTIINHTVEDDDLRANLWNTLWTGTMWDMRKVQAVIDSGMRGAFDVHWRQMLKGMGKREIIALANHNGVDNHLVLNPNGGMDSWLVKDGYAYHAMYYQTIDDIITAMWAIFPKIDGWVKVAKGDIYPSMDDDDTQELERVGEDDETVPGVVVDNSPMAEFIANVKAKLLDAKSTPMCGVSSVASSTATDWEWYEIWCEGDGWRIYRSLQSKKTRLDSRHQQALYLNIESVINRMWELVPRPHYWQVFRPVGGHDEQI